MPFEEPFAFDITVSTGVKPITFDVKFKASEVPSNIVEKQVHEVTWYISHNLIKVGITY